MGKEHVQAFPQKQLYRSTKSLEKCKSQPQCAANRPLCGCQSSENLNNIVCKDTKQLKLWCCQLEAQNGCNHFRKYLDYVLQKQISSYHLTHKLTPTRLPQQTELYIPRKKGKEKKSLDTFCPNRFVAKTWNPPDFHQMKDFIKFHLHNEDSLWHIL